jgi:hypothetical protein
MEEEITPRIARSQQRVVLICYHCPFYNGSVCLSVRHFETVGYSQLLQAAVDARGIKLKKSIRHDI